MKVLMIDDSPALINLVKRIVVSMGHTMLQAPDGKRGLEVLASEKPDCVILDWNMPVMNGMEVLAFIRGELKNDLPVFMLTAECLDEQINEALEKGATGYLIKPVQPDALRERLKSVQAG